MLTSSQKENLEFWSLCRVPMFIFGLISQILIFGAIGFLQPTMALHLKSYEGFETFWIGLFFSTPAITYILGSLLLSLYLKYIGRRGVIFIAFILLVTSCFFIGTSPLLRLKDTPNYIITGLCLVGFAASAITIPVLPEMLDQIVLKYPNLKDNVELNDACSGYFNGCLGIGEAIGPIISSVLVASMGFRTACDVFALIVFVYTLFYFIFNGRHEMLYPDTKPEETVELIETQYITTSISDDFKKLENEEHNENFNLRVLKR